MSKKDIRKRLLLIRNNLANKDALSTSINIKVIDFIQTLNKKNPQLKIASFLSLTNEIDTSLINSTFKIYLPTLHPTIKHGLWFIRDNGNYYKNKYKIKEPIYKATDVVAPWELDVVIVPIVGFNQNKYRMGMGGGFYDYSLSFKKHLKKPITVGIAFDEQQNNDIIINSYDIKLDLIITPKRIL